MRQAAIDTRLVWNRKLNGEKVLRFPKTFQLRSDRQVGLQPPSPGLLTAGGTGGGGATKLAHGMMTLRRTGAIRGQE